MSKYKKNFLTEVILRIDFENPIKDFNDNLNESFESEILKYFTLKDVKEAFSELIKIDPRSEKVDRQKSKFKEWNFYGNEKMKRFCITKDFLFIIFKKYLNYEDFITPFISVLNVLKIQYDNFSAKRIGMRYINNIKLDEPNPFAWKDYINKNLLTIFNVPENKNKISRAFHILELNYNTDAIKLKYQYGMHNPDYPATIKKKLYVLDIDAYKVGILTIDEIEHIIPLLHDKIESLFEKSITPKLRDKMNE